MIVLICTSLANLIATLKNSRCSEIESLSHCCYCDIIIMPMIKRERLDSDYESEIKSNEANEIEGLFNV